MKLAMTGQLFGPGGKAGPLFVIHELGPESYTGLIISHLTGEVLAMIEDTSTINRACELIYEHKDW